MFQNKTSRHHLYPFTLDRFMRILLLGGTGFIGTALTQELQKNNHEVIATSRIPKPNSRLFNPFNRTESATFLAEINADIAVNLSWVTKGKNYLESTSNFDALAWSKEFYDLLKYSSIRKVISIGSSAEYGNQSVFANGVNTPKNGKTLYAKCKLEAWLHLQKVADLLQIEHVWVRVFQAYGLNQHEEKLIPTLLSHAKNQRVFSLSRPDTILDWIEVSDIARGIAFLVENESPAELDLGTSIGMSNLELCSLFARKVRLRFQVSEDHLSLKSQCVVDRGAFLLRSCPPIVKIDDFLEKIKM